MSTANVAKAAIYDVFLSYNTCDLQAVEEIAHQLHNVALRVFFDRWDLVPGELWDDALVRAREESNSYAFFWGPSSHIGDWQKEELRIAIAAQAKDGSKFRVIPVLLSGAGRDSLPPLLQGRHAVDLNDPDGFARLVAGILGEPPTHDPSKHVRRIGASSRALPSGGHPTTGALRPDSYYLRWNIFEIVRELLAKEKLNIQALRHTIDLTITDLEQHCISEYPQRDRWDIRRIVFEARRKAYAIKYGGRTSATDERYTDIAAWRKEFANLLREVGFPGQTDRPVLCVGIGTGAEGVEVYDKFLNLSIADVSQESLERARGPFPHARIVCDEAEVLAGISNCSQELYISLRTFQSTLFDVDAASVQAFRVLRPGGSIIVSVPYIYYSDGSLLTGLPHPGSTTLDEELPYWYCERIRRSFRKLGLRDIRIYTGTFEIYVIAQRSLEPAT